MRARDVCICDAGQNLKINVNTRNGLHVIFLLYTKCYKWNEFMRFTFFLLTILHDASNQYLKYTRVLGPLSCKCNHFISQCCLWILIKIYIYLFIFRFNCNWQFSEILITLSACGYIVSWTLFKLRLCHCITSKNVSIVQWEKKRCLFR